MSNTQSPAPKNHRRSVDQASSGRIKVWLLVCLVVVVLVSLAVVSIWAWRKAANPSPISVEQPTATSLPDTTSLATTVVDPEVTSDVPTPTPMPFLPALQYYLSPRSRLLHTEEADVDDDGVRETIVLYQDTSSFSSFIRGMIAEPPTPQTPTPDPSSEEAYLSDVFWLGPGAADELFGESWDGLKVQDINGDGQSELLLWGKWDASTHAVHVYQRSALGYEALLSLQSKAEIHQQEDPQGRTSFSTVELMYPRSGIVQRTLAHWTDEGYLIESEPSWAESAQDDRKYPESSILEYYLALSEGDLDGAKQLWSRGLAERAIASELQLKLETMPSLQLSSVELMIESAESARASVSLRWTDADTGERRRSNDEIWDLVLEDGQWHLDRLNSTPADVAWNLFTVADGLAEDSLKDLALDTTDRMWIATATSGLTVWDGTYWSVVQARPEGLANDQTTALEVDNQGRLWIGTAAGITRWDGMRWLTFTSADGLPSDDVLAIALAGDQSVWTATGQGIAYLEEEHWQPVEIPNEAAGLSVTSLTLDANGDLWVAFARDARYEGTAPVGRLTEGGWDWLTVQEGLPKSSISQLLLDADGRLWAALSGNSQGGLAYWTGSNWTRIELSSAGGTADIAALDVGPDGHLWAASEQGVVHGWMDDWVIEPWPASLTAEVSDVLVTPRGTVYFAADSGLLQFRAAMPLQVLGGGR